MCTICGVLVHELSGARFVIRVDRLVARAACALAGLARLLGGLVWVCVKGDRGSRFCFTAGGEGRRRTQRCIYETITVH